MKTFYTIICLVFLLSVGHAQKVKYKDVFPLVSAKNYEEGESLLRAYMNDKKNFDDPNANLQMAYLLEKYANEYSVVADSSLVYQNADSAIYFYNQAILFITEKELNKNDEYYKEFYRRDLRTGEFGIKLSDVALELNTKVLTLQKRIKNAKEINRQLNFIDATFDQILTIYKSLVDPYENYNDFLLASGEQQIDLLKKIVEKDFEIISASGVITQSIIDINNAGFRMIDKRKSIENISTDGRSKPNFYAGDFAIWDYADWAKQSIKSISDKAIPARQALLTCLDRLMKVESKIKVGDSVDPSEELKISDAELVLNIDSNSLAFQYLKAKSSELYARYLKHEKYHPQILDTGAVSFHIARSKELYTVVTRAKLVSEDLTNDRINAKSQVYPEFYEKFGTTKDFATVAKEVRDWLTSETVRSASALSMWTSKAKWAIFENDQMDIDSLYSGAVMSKTLLNGEFWPLAKVVDSLKNIYLVGVTGTATNLQGFVTGVADSREGLWRKNFDIYKKRVTSDSWQIYVKFVGSGVNTFTCYLFETSYSSDKNLTIIHFDDTGKILWNVGLNVPLEPVSVKYNTILGETILFLVEEDKIAQLSADQKGYIVIDRNGNVR